MKTALFLLAVATLAGLWAFERIATARLAVELATAREHRRELADLRRERERLRGLQPTEDEFEQLRRGTGRARLAAELAASETAPATPAPALPLGEWSAAREWTNRGNASPQAAIETTLWAAAGGDADTLKRYFTFTDATRQKIAGLFAGLPASARARYATADDLIAEFTIKNIPLGEAQLVWLNQPGAEDASACLFLQNPREAAGSVDFSSAAADSPGDPNRGPEPPRAADNGKSSVTYLSLHREPDGWRLIVPPSAVEKLAQELQRPPRS